MQTSEKYLNSVKAGARILRSRQGQAPLRLLIDVGYNNPDDYTGLEHEHRHHGHEHLSHEHYDYHDHDHYGHGHHYHGHDNSAHLDNDGFVSILFESNRPFKIKKFEHFLQNNLPQTVFRAKEILWFEESDLRNIFQLSGSHFSIDGEEWSTPPRNQLIFIGRQLNGDEIQQQLTACLA